MEFLRGFRGQPGWGSLVCWTGHQRGKGLRVCTPAKTEIQESVWPSQECCTSFSRKDIHNRLDIQTNLNCDLMAHTVISLQGKVLSINHVNIAFVTPLHVLLNFLMKSWEWSSTGPELGEQRERGTWLEILPSSLCN